MVLCDVIDIKIGLQEVILRDGVVTHSYLVQQAKIDFPAPARQLGRLDEFRVLMRAAREKIENVFRADDGKQICLWIAIDRREKEEDRPV